MIEKIFTEDDSNDLKIGDTPKGETLIGLKDHAGVIMKPYVDKPRKVRTGNEDRDFSNLAHRVLYLLINVFYKVIWFYFAPFAAFILSYWLPFQMGGYAGTRGCWCSVQR